MKSFIVLLVVAVAAAQSLDTLKLTKTDALDKLGLPTVGKDVLLKKKLLGHPLERSIIYGDNVEVPRYLQDEIVEQPIYKLEEIVAHPLFRVYYQLPLFQQYWQYEYFQRYVASIYFQRFWEVPAFRQYFVNPVLFYKYIYPVVQIFQYQYQQQEQTTRYYPYYYYNTVEDFPVRSKNDYVVPFVNNQYVRNQVYAQSLLERIYGQLNKDGRLNEVYTDVQFTPEGKVQEQTVGQIVDPVTGEVKYSVGDAKLVSETVVPIQQGIYNQWEQQEQQYKYNYVPTYYNRYQPTYYKYNPLVARLFQGYYGQRFPVYNKF